ncbi:D-alanyl-D-alanine carboxypeptidase family protein [Altererythrobacter aquiaggeris]|uniref:D-alanyl-D-alanine carboxypeptidase family protein n=1 Tax=Aestuarierythrobacter aquiaggeris TaxID=1898396 RepID=UPI00301906C4
MSRLFQILLLLAVVSFPVRISAMAGIPAADDAPIALMLDLNSGQTLFARDSDRRFVPASITKVMTTLVAFQMMEERRISARQSFVMDETTFEDWHRKGSTMFLPLNQRVTVDQLLMGITTVSANDASVLLALNAAGSVDGWIDQMNKSARKLGMNNSYFGTPNGWPDEGRTFTTARDLAKLARALVERHPELYGRYIGNKGMSYNGIAQDNHDPTIGVVNGADGIKTGFTNQAGYGFLGTAARDGRRVVMIVAGSSSAGARNRAAREFLEWGLANFESRRIFRAGQILAEIPVQDGNAGHVNLVAPEDIFVTFPKGQDPGVELNVRYRGPVRAPFGTDTAIADLQVQVEGLPTTTVPLVSDIPVERAGVFWRLYNGLRSLV